MELLKLLSANEIIAQVISFLILLLLLRAFAWKKLLGLLDKRKQNIASEFKNIAATKEELESLKAQYEGQLKSIDKIAKDKIEDALRQSQRESEEIHKKANEEAQDIIEAAKQNIKYELAKAKEELKEQIIDLTITATENVIQEKLTADDDKKIVENFLKRLDEVNER